MKTASSRTMCLPAGILYSLLVVTSCSEFHDKVFSNLLRMCPGQYVPTDNVTLLDQTSEFDSCCTDNFTSFSTRNSVLDRTRQVTNGQKCLFPRTDDFEEEIQNERSYFMITDPPKEGCLLPDTDTETIKGINHPTCNDSDVKPFRRFLPVFSKSSGFVYKNSHCASCHGHHDVIPWTTYAYCKTPAELSFELGECIFQFVYPGDHDDIQNLECFTDYYSACPVDTRTDYDRFLPVTDLSVTELSDACAMDNLPRFTDSRFAKNVFCYICHYCNDGCRYPKRSCTPPVKDKPLRVFGHGFARILDSRVVNQLHSDRDTVCDYEQDERVCHEVICPLGQVLTFDGLEKKCQMDSTLWTARQFSTLLLLEFDQSIDVHDNNIKPILMRTSWPKTWSLKILYRPIVRNVDMVRVHEDLYNVTKALSVNSLRHVYVDLAYRHKNVNPDVLLRELENLRMKSLYLTIDGKRYRARQTLGKSNFWTIKVALSPGDIRQLSMPVWQIYPDVEPYKRLLYKLEYNHANSKSAYILNRLMLCKQVELASKHFRVTTLYDVPILLYYNKTGQRIYNNEFAKGSGRNDEQSFRICVSDARLGSNKSGRLQISLKLLLLSTAIFNVL